MVQFFLRTPSAKAKWVMGAVASALLLFPNPRLAASRPKDKTPAVGTAPELHLDGGRKLTFERSISDERDVRVKKGFWKKVLDVVAGEPAYHKLIRPYGVVTDSRRRILVSDPGARGIHIFDFAAQKYKFISRLEGKETLRAPQCLAVDKQDNIYVTDSESGKVFVFNREGKYARVIGSLKGGEGYFKRPTGIAVDSEAQRIYVTDTLRDKVIVMDLQGSVLKMIGQPGTENGEFSFPTELRLQGDALLVVDTMNFRVQAFTLDGTFRFAVGHVGDTRGSFFRPKGVALDSEGHIYVVDGYYAVVQVFNPQGELLYYFGRKGSGFGDFQLPSGLFVDGQDYVFVADSFNRRVQEFHYFGLAKKENGTGR